MKWCTLVPLLLLTTISLPLIQVSIGASVVNFRINNLQATAWINEDSSIDLYYRAEITCESGTLSILPMNLNSVEFILGEATDDQGRDIDIYLDGSGSPVLKFSKPIPQGSSLGFNFTANVQKMVYLEEGSPEKAILNFKPATWNASVTAIMVLLVLPEGAKAVDATATPQFNYTQIEEESGRLMLVWEGSVGKDEVYALNVSYPIGLQPERVTVRSGWDAFVEQYIIPNRVPILAAIIILLAIVPFTREIRRKILD